MLVCPYLPCKGEPNPGHSTSDVVSQVPNRGEEPLPFICKASSEKSSHICNVARGFSLPKHLLLFLLPHFHSLAKSLLTGPLAFSAWAALPSLVLSATLKFARSTHCSYLQEGRRLVNKDPTSLCLSVYNVGKQYFSLSLG